MSIWRRIDINLQTGKTVLYHPVLPLVLHTPKMPVQVSQCPSTQGKDRHPHSCPLAGKPARCFAKKCNYLCMQCTVVNSPM